MSMFNHFLLSVKAKVTQCLSKTSRIFVIDFNRLSRSSHNLPRLLEVFRFNHQVSFYDTWLLRPVLDGKQRIFLLTKRSFRRSHRKCSRCLGSESRTEVSKAHVRVLCRVSSDCEKQRILEKRNRYYFEKV